MIDIAPLRPDLPNSSAPFDVVAIAASLGGLEVLIPLLGALPPEFPAAVVVVQHRNPTRPGAMVNILASRTALPVLEARTGCRLQGGTITVAPPNQHLTIDEHGLLCLSDEPKVQFARPSADIFFESVANHFRERAIGIVLTGKLRDGAAGVKAIREAGGWVLVQDPATADADGMPNAAIASGCAHFVLAPASIASALITLTMVPGAAQLFHRPVPTSVTRVA